MATPTDIIDNQPTTPIPDFEPEEEWKAGLRERIEDTLMHVAEKLKRELKENLKRVSPLEDSKVQIDYDNAMAELRRTADEQYHQLLDRERQERRWAVGEKVSDKWSETFMKEQEALLDRYKKVATKAKQPEGTRDEEHSLSPQSAKVPDRASHPSESITKDST